RGISERPPRVQWQTFISYRSIIGVDKIDVILQPAPFALIAHQFAQKLVASLRNIDSQGLRFGQYV
ncbi:MAG: hypothetical protein WC853_14560, partial [Thermodesulfovibrionales bacterium]